MPVGVPSEGLQDVTALVHRLHDIPHSSPECIGIIRALLPHVAEVKGEQAQEFIDLLDNVLDTAKLDKDLFRKCLRALRKICGSTGLLPTSHMLTKGLTKLGGVPVASGGFADVWLGDYSDIPVAIKALRIYRDDDQQILKQTFCREVVIWKRLLDENILPLIGVSTALFPFCMVSPWMPNGNLTEYVRSNPAANRVELLLGIAKGLEFLHSYDIVHGDLKGANILINGSGQACLADFGLTTTMSNLGTLNASTLVSRRNGTVRWMAPELLDPEFFGLPASPNVGFSTASDVYALAMVVIELFTGNKPFYEFINEPSVIVKVINGERPSRPGQSHTLGLSDHLWELVQLCWHQDSSRRPDISSVLSWIKTPPQILESPCSTHVGASSSSVAQVSSTTVNSQGGIKSDLTRVEKHSGLNSKEDIAGFRDHRDRIGLAKWSRGLLGVLFPCINW